MKRWLVLILIFLLAGAVVNVAVAWGCALWSGRGETWIASDYISSENARSIPQEVRSIHEAYLPSEWTEMVEASYGATGFGHAIYTIRDLQSRDHYLETSALFVGWPRSAFKAYHTYYTRGARVVDWWESGILWVVGERWIPGVPAWVAVGTPLSRGPPHRSVREGLPHTAPTSGV